MVPGARTIPGFEHASPILADPSIFYRSQAQSDGGFKAIADIYWEAGLEKLVEAPAIAEAAGMERLLEHWRDLDKREPMLKIVCPDKYDYSKRRYGVFPDGCPNLIWELMRTRRDKLSASQLMRRNPSEAILDRDNHLRDCAKYIVLSLPRPCEVPVEITRERIVKTPSRTEHIRRLEFSWPDSESRIGETVNLSATDLGFQRGLMTRTTSRLHELGQVRMRSAAQNKLICNTE